MKSKKDYSTIRRGRKTSPVLLVMVLAIFAIVVIGIVLGIFIATQTVGSVVGNSYSMSCSVSSSDVIVDINCCDRSDDIEYITIAIDGINIPTQMALKPVNDRTYPRTVLYENLAVGIYGTKTVSIQATFNDGSSKVVWINSVEFS